VVGPLQVQSDGMAVAFKGPMRRFRILHIDVGNDPQLKLKGGVHLSAVTFHLRASDGLQNEHRCGNPDFAADAT
jgi:hypothetical protein